MSVSRESSSGPSAPPEAAQGSVASSAIGLHRHLADALVAAGQLTLPRVQAIAIPPALLGRDVFAASSPGADTSGAFVLPIVHRLLTEEPAHPSAPHHPRALLLAPTADIGEGIAEVAQRYSARTRVRRWVALDPEAGGAPPRRDYDMLIATPGGLLDLLHHGHLELSAVEMVALASFERMLQPECLAAVGRVIHHLPANRQLLLFHGGLPGYAEELAMQILRDPVCVVAEQGPSGAARVAQGVVHVGNDAKRQTLLSLIAMPPVMRALVFTRTKHAALAVGKAVRAGRRGVEVMHGDLSERAQKAALSRFWDGRSPVMVTTDMAIRDIEIGPVSHVINYDLPPDASDYVARMARIPPGTEAGCVISLCSEAERTALGRIERHLGDPIPTVDQDLEVLVQPPVAARRTRRASPRTPR